MGAKSNAHRRLPRNDATQLLSHVGGVNAPVGSRDPVYNVLSHSCWATEIGDNLQVTT